MCQKPLINPMWSILGRDSQKVKSFYLVANLKGTNVISSGDDKPPILIPIWVRIINEMTIKAIEINVNNHEVGVNNFNKFQIFVFSRG